MRNSGPPGLLSPAERERWRSFLEQRRRKRRLRVKNLQYVPVRALHRPDGRFDDVLVVGDEFLVPADRCTDARRRSLGQRCEDVTDTHPRANAGFRRFRSSEVTHQDEDDARPAYLGVVAGRMKGGPTAEPASAQPQPQPNVGSTAYEPVVVVIDTGIDAAAIDGAGPPSRQRQDPWLGRVQLADGGDIHLDRLDMLEPIGGLDLSAGHGTFVTGMIAQVSHAAKISMVRAFDTDGFASDEEIASAILQAASMFPDGRGVLNLSFGVETLNDTEPDVIASALAALPDEVVVVAAAGNVATGTPFWPAASSRVLAVGALNNGDGKPAEWSNFGDWVDFSARGEGLVGPYVAGTETAGSGDPDDPFDPDPDTFDGPDAFATWAGTSFSTAQVSGLAAQLLAADPQLTRDEITRELQAMGTASAKHGYILSIL